ncbi:MAG: hypothetical protein ABEJ43_03635 [Haloferacaceae archaeon]
MGSNPEGQQFTPTSLRDPADLMQPARLSALKQTRLSFARVLMDKMVEEQWDIYVDRGDIDEYGVGRVVYAIDTPAMRLSFGVFSHSTEGENTDRIIADNWDMWGFLCEGEATPALMDDQFEQLPHVREGRATTDILIWTRANRSSRFFGHVVEALTEGHQPDIEFCAQGGYLMRSSGYYGNGLNGTKQFEAMHGDHPLKGPYMAQMLSVYLLRIFSYDLAERIAAERSSTAVRLDPEIKRYLGTGNSSGIGIIHYVINHPQLIHAWLRAREVAIARVKTIDPSPQQRERFLTVLGQAEQWFAADESDTEEFFLSKDRIADGVADIRQQVESLAAASDPDPLWTRLCDWGAANLEMETEELLYSLLIDVHPEVCRGLEDTMTVAEERDLDPAMSVARLQEILTSEYQWALDIDMSAPGARRYFWYRSVESEEPRLGIRGKHDYEEYGLPIDIAQQVQRLAVDLQDAPPTESVAAFLVAHPEHRGIVERIQTVHSLPYAEIRTNPLDREFVPLSLISCLKAIWGIQKAHPKSKGWVRGTFYQGAPLPSDIRSGEGGYWLYPEQPERAPHWRDY